MDKIKYHGQKHEVIIAERISDGDIKLIIRPIKKSKSWTDKLLDIVGDDPTDIDLRLLRQEIKRIKPKKARPKKRVKNSVVSDIVSGLEQFSKKLRKNRPIKGTRVQVQSDGSYEQKKVTLLDGKFTENKPKKRKKS